MKLDLRGEEGLHFHKCVEWKPKSLPSEGFTQTAARVSQEVFRVD